MTIRQFQRFQKSISLDLRGKSATKSLPSIRLTSSTIPSVISHILAINFLSASSIPEGLQLGQSFLCPAAKIYQIFFALALTVSNQLSQQKHDCLDIPIM